MSLSNELSQLRQIRRTAAQGTDDGIIHTAISANVAGDNILIVPPGPRFSIFELFLWNGSQTQTLILKDGALTLVPMTGFPAPSGIFFGFAGNNVPHFKVSAGNGLLLNLSVGSLVEGFAKYRIG